MEQFVRSFSRMKILSITCLLLLMASLLSISEGKAILKDNNNVDKKLESLLVSMRRSSNDENDRKKFIDKMFRRVSFQWNFGPWRLISFSDSLLYGELWTIETTEKGPEIVQHTFATSTWTQEYVSFVSLNISCSNCDNSDNSKNCSIVFCSTYVGGKQLTRTLIGFHSRYLCFLQSATRICRKWRAERVFLRQIQVADWRKQRYQEWNHASLSAVFHPRKLSIILCCM